jgi:cytidylate kinase
LSRGKGRRRGERSHLEELSWKVVLPEADLKVFLSASPDERARRRALQTGRTEEIERIHEAMQKRDRQDYEREASPLKAAPDAEVLDTTGISFEAVVSRVARLARGRQGAPEEAS